MRFHRLFAALLAGVYIGIFIGALPWLSGFHDAVIGEDLSQFHLKMRFYAGAVMIYLLALFSVYLLMFPSSAMVLMSPQSSLTGAYVLTERVWVLAGFVCMIGTFMAVYAFE